MQVWKKIIRIGDSKGIILDKTLINGNNIEIGDEALIDIIKFKKQKSNDKK